MGKAYQAWSAASYIAAYQRFQGDTAIEVSEQRTDEITQRQQSGQAPTVTNGSVDSDTEVAPRKACERRMPMK